jgi:hypothetical protein
MSPCERDRRGAMQLCEAIDLSARRTCGSISPSGWPHGDRTGSPTNHPPCVWVTRAAGDRALSDEDPKLKGNAGTGHMWSWSADPREAELAKCQVLCYDHHRKKTHGGETLTCLMAANGMSRVADATCAARPLSGLAVEGFVPRSASSELFKDPDRAPGKEREEDPLRIQLQHLVAVIHDLERMGIVGFWISNGMAGTPSGSGWPFGGLTYC